jgi:hypothetical protein
MIPHDELTQPMIPQAPSLSDDCASVLVMGWVAVKLVRSPFVAHFKPWTPLQAFSPEQTIHQDPNAYDIMSSVYDKLNDAS